MPNFPRTVIISSERFPHVDTSTQQVIKNSTAIHFAGLPVELQIPVQPPHFYKWNYDLPSVISEYYNVPKGLKIKCLWNVPANDLRTEKFFHTVFATLRAVLNPRVDLVYTRNKTIGIMCLFLGQKFVFETYRKFGDDNPKAMRFLAKKANRGKTFVGMVLHSRVAADSMLRAGFTEDKLYVLHNGYDASDMQPKLSKVEARKKLGLALDECFVVYTGNMQVNKSVESIIDIAAHLPSAKFLLVGGKPEDVERLQAHAQKVGAHNLILTGHRPIAEISTYLYASDALIIPPAGAPLQKFGKTVLPFKIFPYLAAGRPIIAPDLSDMKELLHHNENAILVPVDAPKENAKAIGDLLENTELQNRLSANAAAASKSLTWEERGKKLVKWIGEMYSKS